MHQNWVSLRVGFIVNVPSAVGANNAGQRNHTSHHQSGQVSYAPLHSMFVGDLLQRLHVTVWVSRLLLPHGLQRPYQWPGRRVRGSN